jgi:A/G-specific adenine glycosylase
VSIAPARRAALRRRLLAWYDASRRDLPWRTAQHGADPYRVWLAEAMLQQTQVARVIPYYCAFLEAFPTLEALAAAEEEAVLARWSGLGYYARARALRRAAREALARHGGLPASVEALRALPGFGPYTAGAVASIAFAIPAAAVDGNVARVLARLQLVEGDPAAPATRAALWALAAALVDPARPGDWNQALMELGATTCGSPVPRCSRCPLARLCRARAAGREREVPRPRRRASPKGLLLACAAVARDGRWLLARQPGEGLFGGLWGLPLAVAPGESRAPEALLDAMRQRWGIRPEVGPEVARARRILTHRRLTLVAFACKIGRLRRSGDLRWAAPEELGQLGVASAMKALMAGLPAPGRRVGSRPPATKR